MYSAGNKGARVRAANFFPFFFPFSFSFLFSFPPQVVYSAGNQGAKATDNNKEKMELMNTVCSHGCRVFIYQLL
jgi:hypothetical protein